MLPDRPLVRRRTALTGALGGIAATLLAAGCDTGDDVGGNDASESPSSSPSVAQEPEQTPDEALVDEVLAQLGAAVAVLQSSRRFKQLRPTVAPLLQAHRSHVEALEGELGGEATAPRPANSSAATEAIRSSERPAPGRARRRRRPGRERRAREAARVDVGVDDTAPRDAPAAAAPVPRMTTELDALQATLAAEHAAVYVYGLLGSRTSETAESELYVGPARGVRGASRPAGRADRRDRGAGGHPDAGRPGVHPAGRAGHDRRPLPGGAGAGAGLRVDVRRPRGSHGWVAPARGHRAPQ